MHPVMAISPKPFFEMAIDAKASPTELPHERTVIPSSATEIPVSMPNKIRRSTMIFAMRYTQTIDIRKDATYIHTSILPDGLLRTVTKWIQTPKPILAVIKSC